MKSITKQKPFEEIEQLLEGLERVFIIGCGTCATMTRTGGREEVLVMKERLQGAGKTTPAGKLAAWLKNQGHQPLLVAADLQRPNAVDQLRIVGERVDDLDELFGRVDVYPSVGRPVDTVVAGHRPVKHDLL